MKTSVVVYSIIYQTLNKKVKFVNLLFKESVKIDLLSFTHIYSVVRDSTSTAFTDGGWILHRSSQCCDTMNKNISYRKK